MVAEYDPVQELVVVLKSGDRTSTYRVRNLWPRLQEDMANEVTSGHTAEQAKSNQSLPLPHPRQALG
jgi:hypothetical protein